MKKLFKNKIFKQSAVFLLALSLMLGGLFIFNNPALANGEDPVKNTNTDVTYSTIQEAIEDATAGDVIEVADGTYTYATEGSPAPKGLIKVTKGVTIKAAEGVRPIIDGTGSDGVFKIHPAALDNGNTVIIEGFEITGDPSTGIAITMQGCFNLTPARVVINDNWFNGMIGGIDFWGATSYLPDDWTSGVINTEITNNKFYDMVAAGGNPGFGILIESPLDWDTADNDYAVKIENNEFSNLPSGEANYGTGISILDMGGTLINANVLISSNTFTNDVPVGAYFNNVNATTTKIINNNFMSNGVLAENIANGPIDSKNNWWGTAVKSTIEGKISDDVDFKPYYVDSEMTILSDESLTTVYVDDDYSDRNAGEYIFGYNAFSTIKEAITAVNEGGTVQVAAGTYNEIGQILIDKNLTILGEDKATTIVTPATPTNTSIYTDGAAWFRITDGVSATIQNLTLDGVDQIVNTAIQSRGNVVVENCLIKNIYSAQHMGIGVQLLSGENNQIINCEFENIERIGIHVRGGKDGDTEPIAEINNCKYTGRGVGDYLEYGIEFGGGGSGTVDNFTVSDVLGEGSGWDSGGILATDLYGTGTSAEVTNSSFLDNLIGIIVGYNDSDTTTLIATENIFSGNSQYGIRAEDSVTVTAINNRWGSENGPTHSSNPEGDGDAVSDNISFRPWLLENQAVAVADGEGNVEVDESKTEIIFNSQSSDVKNIVVPDTIADSTEVVLDFTALTTTTDDSTEVTLSGNNMSLKRESTYNYSAEIPAGTKISGNGWDGKLILPTVKAPADYSVSGGNVGVVIEMGSSVELTFDKAVKVVLGGQTGKKAGWTRGTSLTEITTQCNSATDHSIIDETNGECYWDDGTDLIIWTYHFTKFASFTPVTSTQPTSSGGGGGSAPVTGPGSISSAPSSLTVNSINVPMVIAPSQEGTMTNNLGEGTTLNLEVPAGAVSDKTTFETKMSSVEEGKVPAETSGAFMVGNKVFNITATDSANQAVRSFNDNLKITITIPDLPADTTGLGVYWFNEKSEQWNLVPGAEFDPTTGKVIFSVNHLTMFSVMKGDGETVIDTKVKIVETDTSIDEVVVLGVEHYEDGALLRGSDKKVYVINNGQKYHIKSLKELYKYAGEPIFDVDDETLNKYPEIKVLGLEHYEDGALLRGSDKKVYVIENGKKKHILNLEELRKYAGRKINDVSEDVIERY